MLESGRFGNPLRTIGQTAPDAICHSVLDQWKEFGRGVGDKFGAVSLAFGQPISDRTRMSKDS